MNKELKKTENIAKRNDFNTEKELRELEMGQSTIIPSKLKRIELVKQKVYELNSGSELFFTTSQIGLKNCIRVTRETTTTKTERASAISEVEAWGNEQLKSN